MSQKRKILRVNLLRAFGISFPAFSFSLLSFFFFHFCSIAFIHPVVSFLPFFSSMLLSLCSLFFSPSPPFLPCSVLLLLHFLFLFFHTSPFHNFTFILLHSSLLPFTYFLLSLLSFPPPFHLFLNFSNLSLSSSLAFTKLFFSSFSAFSPILGSGIRHSFPFGVQDFGIQDSAFRNSA
jgi:hypothetical protein